MSRRDDYLEERLSEMEQEAEPKNFLLGEDDSGEEAALVNLASSIREFTHPELDPAIVGAEKRRIVSAAREKYPPKKSLGALLNGRFKGQWLFVSGVAGAGLIILFAFVLAAGVGLYFSGPRGAQAATLIESSGFIEVSSTGFADEWTSISTGDLVRAGQRIRTGSNSTVTIEFFEGTQATLGPNTDLVLSKIDGDWGNELQVELIQNSGETGHQVVPLQGELASYQVLTPSGSASVRGTSFTVSVENTGLSLFTVETGEVLVTNESGESYVSAGQGLVTDLGEPMDDPIFLFTLQGELIESVGKTWQVEDIEIIIRDGTRIYGDPQDGDIMLVNGHINRDHEWVAHRIESPFTDGKGGTLTGTVTAIGADSIEINGISFVYTGDLSEVSIGDIVRVTFRITSNGWEIENLHLLDDDRIPDDDNGDDDPDHDEALFFHPEKHKVPVCEAEADAAREFMTTLNFVVPDESESSIDVLLDYLITEGEEYVAEVTLSADDVILTPDTVVTVMDGVPVTVKVKITLKPEFEKVPPEEEIKVKVISLDPVGNEPLSNYFVAKWECDEELPDDDTDDDGDKDGHYCTTDDIHPHAAQLEEKYSDLADFGATYENIMIWFCQFNLGFGEIEQAFKLFRLYREEIALIAEVNMIQDIIDMRLSGLGWGQVKKAMAHLANEVLPDDGPEAKKEPPGKKKSEEAKNKEKPEKKENPGKKKDD